MRTETAWTATGAAKQQGSKKTTERHLKSYGPCDEDDRGEEHRMLDADVPRKRRTAKPKVERCRV